MPCMFRLHAGNEPGPLATSDSFCLDEPVVCSTTFNSCQHDPPSNQQPLPVAAVCRPNLRIADNPSKMVLLPQPACLAGVLVGGMLACGGWKRIVLLLVSQFVVCACTTSPSLEMLRRAGAPVQCRGVRELIN